MCDGVDCGRVTEGGPVRLLQHHLAVHCVSPPQPNPVNFAKLCKREKGGQGLQAVSPISVSWLLALVARQFPRSFFALCDGCLHACPHKETIVPKGEAPPSFTNVVCHRSKSSSSSVFPFLFLFGSTAKHCVAHMHNTSDNVLWWYDSNRLSFQAMAACPSV